MNAADDFFTDHLFVENAGRRTFSTFFKKDRFLDLMLVNFENASSEVDGYSMLVFIQNSHKRNFENSSCPHQGYGVGGKISESDSNSDLSKISNSDSLT